MAGKALSDFKNKIAETTKFSFNYTANKINEKSAGPNSRTKRIREMVEVSLKRLKVDVIKLLYQHRYDPNVPIEDVAGQEKTLLPREK